MERPAKKPRPQGPDGFQKSRSTSRYKPPESITKFVSAFDSAPPSPVKPAAQSKGPSEKKPVSFSSHELPRNPFVDCRVPREPEAGPSRPLPKRQLKPSSSAHPLHIARADKSLSSLQVLKAPAFLSPVAPPQMTRGEPSSKAAGVSLHSRRPTLMRPPASPEKPRSILKPPPVPIPLEAKPFIPLKPLAPPSLPLPSPASPKKLMKTILTTSIAQATDPTKEGTGVELLSLFLQQHGHNFVSSTDRELQRGVMVSPDNRSRGKNPKFLRGGLAERLNHRISCTKTDFVLWKRQMERKVESGAMSGSDMQLRILKVLDVCKVSERPRLAAGPRSGLALCRLMRRHQFTSGDLTLGTYVVLFHFAPTSGGKSLVSGMDHLADGNDVMVWLPWHKVDLVGIKESAGLLDMFQALDTLTPPHSLLVVSRFCIVVPKIINAT